MKQFNLNDFVHVKLNEKGREIVQKDYERYGFSINLEERFKSDKVEGYHMFQFWDFMQIFGEHINIGNYPPIDLDVIMSDEDIKEVEI
jgi:hypothetical protein